MSLRQLAAQFVDRNGLVQHLVAAGVDLGDALLGGIAREHPKWGWCGLTCARFSWAVATPVSRPQPLIGDDCPKRQFISAARSSASPASSDQRLVAPFMEHAFEAIAQNVIVLDDQHAAAGIFRRQLDLRTGQSSVSKGKASEKREPRRHWTPPQSACPTGWRGG